jgi:site-specific DNA-methyltransferase (adenine-specific)
MTPVRIGGCTLYLGDWRWHWEAVFHAGVVVTDPPYGIGFKYGAHSDDPEEYADLIGSLRGARLALLQYPEEMMRLVVPVLGAPDECLAWVYPSNLPRQFRLWGLWGLKANFSAVRQPVKNPGSAKVKSDDAASYDWWEQPQVKGNGSEKTAHPCQIPVSNVERVIRLVMSGMPPSVADPFMGSGTTGVAAVQLGIPFVGIEKDPAYFDIACKRIEQAYAQRPLFESAPQEKPQQMGIEA